MYNRPSTSQEAVLQEIREAIMARRLRPGERVRQLDLAERLNVSAVPVREALKALEAEGQVVYERHRGYKVIELSREQVEEIYLARQLLETEMTRRAVSTLDAELIQSLESLVVRMDELVEARNVLGYVDTNREFHFLLFGRANLPRIYHMTELLWQSSEAYRGLISDAAWRRQAQGDHRAILAACKAKDVDRAIAAQEAHNSNALAKIVEFLEESEA
jgi:DNA-binding GntR family transcriptional regulator